MKHLLAISAVVVLSVAGYFTLRDTQEATVSDPHLPTQSTTAEVVATTAEKEHEEKQLATTILVQPNEEAVQDESNNNEDNPAQLAHSVQQMVSDYFGASGDERLRLASEISRITTFSDQAQDIELQILDGLFNESLEQDEWAQLLSDIGVRSAEGHNMILAILPTITDDKVLSMVLSSLLPVHVDSDHMIIVSENIKPYLSNDDEFVRASATLTQSLWVDSTERSQVIQTGFIDNSIEVRFSAATAATLSDEQTPEVKEALLNTIADPNEDPLVIEQAENALMNYE